VKARKANVAFWLHQRIGKAMTRRRILTDKMIAALPKKDKRYRVQDPQLSGLVVRVPITGPSAFYAVARTPGGRAGRQIWHKLGNADVLSIAEARDQAREAIKRIRSGQSPMAEIPVQPDSFRSVAETWIARHVIAKKKLRTRPEIERMLKVYVYPQWAAKDFISIKRSDVAALLDHVETKHGATMADRVLEVVRSIANWFATRSDDYVPPFTKDMRRTNPEDRKRKRTLSDDELRRVWSQAGQSNGFGALIKILLLTGQRRGAVLSMKWDDIEDDGTWSVPHNPREKVNAGSLKLPKMALAIIRAQPRYASNPYVFAASRGNGPMNGFSRAKQQFDKRCNVHGWTLHDLRRCARSLMSRAGVRPDIAERTLGHVLPGIQAVYDQHKFEAEKADALSRLSTLVDMIIEGRDAKVVTMVRA
jgi:integrase